jgi:L-ascorbate metabolism protein UlaG (beta-lactamase superfamily)
MTAERLVRSVTITWYGQAGFRIAGGDSRVLIDPYLSKRDNRRYPPVAAPGEFADISLVLCTHEHIDHLDLGFLLEFAAVNDEAKIVVPAPVLDVAVSGGLSQDRLIGAVPGQVLRDRDVTVHPLPALHGVGDDKPVAYEFLDGRYLGYVLEIGGIRFFHSGDGLVYPELAPSLRELAPDVLMLPINGRDFMRESAGLVGNMNEAEAAWLAAEVGPEYVIPMHYEMFVGNTGDVGRFAAQLHSLAADGGPVLVMPSRGRMFTLAITTGGDMK